MQTRSVAAIVTLSIALAPVRAAHAQVSVTDVVLEDYSDVVTLNDLGSNDFSGNSGTINNPSSPYGHAALNCPPSSLCALRFTWDFTINPVPAAFTGLFLSLFGLTDAQGTVFGEHALDLDCIDCPLSEPDGNRSLQDLRLRVRYDGGSALTLRIEVADAAANPRLRFKRFAVAPSSNTQDLVWNFRSDFQAGDNGDLDLHQAKKVTVIIERSNVAAGVTNPDTGALDLQRIWFTPNRPELEPASDDLLLELAERRACQYFLDWSSRKTASAPIPQDRSTFADLLTIGGIGFALPAFTICADRGWINREAAADRVLTVLSLLSDSSLFGPEAAGRIGHRGWFYHFVGLNGRRKINVDDPATPANEALNTVELSVFDTALAVMGTLVVQSYFDRSNPVESDIRSRAQQIYDAVDWPFMLEPASRQFYLSWKPNEPRAADPPFEIPDAAGQGAYSGTPGNATTADFYTDEGLLAILLALGSRTHPVSPAIYCSFIRQRLEGTQFSGIGTWPGALFTCQFLSAFLDVSTLAVAPCPGHSPDNWLDNSRRASLGAIAYAEANATNPLGLPTFGPQAWGISAAEAPDDRYRAYGAPPIKINPTPCALDADCVDGTVTYYGMLSSASLGADLRARIIAALRAAWQRGHWHYRFGLPDAFSDDVSQVKVVPGDFAASAEAESGSGAGSIMTRGNASNQQTVHLSSGTSRTIDITARGYGTHFITTRYSNDNFGSTESVEVRVDDLSIGTFAAADTGDGGQGWNQFADTELPMPATLTPGDHKITISVTGGDGGGMEIDQVRIRFAGSLPQRSWVQRAKFAIDEGPALLHLANARTSASQRIVWNATAASPNIRRALKEITADFADPFVIESGTLVRAVHIEELRSRIDALRAARKLTPAFTGQPLAGVVLSIHVAELRSALADVYTDAGLTPPTYTDDPLIPGVTPIRAVHISQLRTAVRALEQ